MLDSQDLFIDDMGMLFRVLKLAAGLCKKDLCPSIDFNKIASQNLSLASAKSNLCPVEGIFKADGF